jgi:hypothetical protein
MMHDYKSCPPSPMESAVRREGGHAKMIENINSQDNNIFLTSQRCKYGKRRG